jgi:outer membrane protein OmpA-like peptidoglycan-associated protein
VVRPEDVADLDHIAQVLNAYPRTRIAIIGYADARGSRRANARLGGQRADAIVGALVARGISAERLEGRSGGEAQPVGSNRSAKVRRKNGGPS